MVDYLYLVEHNKIDPENFIRKKSVLVLMSKKAADTKVTNTSTKLNKAVKTIKQNSMAKVIQTMPVIASIRSKVETGFQKLNRIIRSIEFIAEMVICEKLFEKCILFANFNNLILTTKHSRIKVLHSPPVDVTKKFLSVLAVVYPKQRPEVASINKVLLTKYRIL
jgi:hypothetical protein